MKALLACALSVIVMGCQSRPKADASPPRAAQPTPTLESELASLRKARVYWGHQSVGNDILQGLRAVAELSGGIPLTAIEVGHRAPLGSHFFAHALAGHNEQPASKIAAFETALDRNFDTDPDVAMMKFCFIDFKRDTDTRALFTEYVSTVERLQHKHPRVRIVHVTAPLVVAEHGFRAAIKRWSGFRDLVAPENIRRNEYNALVRARFASEPVFDLARFEATWPDGRRETFERGGELYEALVPAYAAPDGQHLNETGQNRLATELVHLLARIVPCTQQAVCHEPSVLLPKP